MLEDNLVFRKKTIIDGCVPSRGENRDCGNFAPALRRVVLTSSCKRVQVFRGSCASERGLRDTSDRCSLSTGANWRGTGASTVATPTVEEIPRDGSRQARPLTLPLTLLCGGWGGHDPVPSGSCLTACFFFSLQRSIGISAAARCPTTGGMSGLPSSGRRTSTASWGCTGSEPAT